MIIVAIETSCDDTCVAILKIENSKLKILSNVVSSQVKLHAKYGGVWPFLAKREHQKNLPLVFNKAQKGAKLLKKGVGAVAVTVGPGLEPCLWTGINFAKDLAKKMNVPLIPINHIEAHIFANWIEPVGKIFNLQFSIFKRKILPAICLVVSGGHTQLILMKDFGNYKILGETRDDAAGECFDKSARILGLGYPGGPAIASEAAKYKMQNTKCEIQLPRPMINQKNYDFSFSGLKTALLYLVKDLTKDNKKLTPEQKREIAFEIQQAIVDVLISKTLKAAKEFQAKSVILAGGVAANGQLRKQFKEKIKNLKLKINFFVPAEKFCTDNAAMVALTAFFKIARNNFKIKKIDLEKIEANSNLRIDKNLL